VVSTHCAIPALKHYAHVVIHGGFSREAVNGQAAINEDAWPEFNNTEQSIEVHKNSAKKDFNKQYLICGAEHFIVYSATASEDTCKQTMFRN